MQVAGGRKFGLLADEGFELLVSGVDDVAHGVELFVQLGEALARLRLAVAATLVVLSAR